MPHRRKFFHSQNVPLNILIIDATEQYLQELNSILQNNLPASSQVNLASDMNTARRFLASNSYDCILIDVNFFDDNGNAFFNELLEIFSHIAVIIITPVHDLEMSLQLIYDGVEDYLVKDDISQEILLKTIRFSVERKTAKNETQKLSQALEKEKQLRALQQEFIALVTHEFRTPLAIIHNAAQMVTMKLPDDARRPVLDRLTKIASCVTRLTQLIDTVVLYSKVEEGHFVFQPETFDLSMLLQEIIERYSDLYGAERIELRGDSLPMAFFGDPQLCEHILANIISNALKYSPQNKAIIIQSIVRPFACSIRIADKGVGMKNEELQRMGEKFFRSSRVNHIAGSGLGMHLAQRFIEYHGGTMFICSEEGVGTTVELRFPLSQN